MFVIYQLIALMFNIYTSYFHDMNILRQQELNTCLQKNIDNKLINKIYLLLDQPLTKDETNFSEKIVPIYLRSRPLYNTIFDLMTIYQGQDDYGAIANSDIYFDETIKEVYKYNHNICLALTRYEVENTGIRFLNRKDSQDVWIVKGKPKAVKGDFGMGIPGCDNAIAWRFEQAGYHVINPSFTIKTYHLHSSQKRNYDVNSKVPFPYKLIMPSV